MIIKDLDISRHLELPDLSQSNSKLIISADPETAPRMVRSDKWRKRKCVLKYFAYRELLQINARVQQFTLSEQFFVLFQYKMPKSWSKKKKAEHLGKPMKNHKDLDNSIKAIADALLPEGDQHIWYIIAKKVWGDHGKIVVINF